MPAQCDRRVTSMNVRQQFTQANQLRMIIHQVHTVTRQTDGNRVLVRAVGGLRQKAFARAI